MVGAGDAIADQCVGHVLAVENKRAEATVIFVGLAAVLDLYGLICPR